MNNTENAIELLKSMLPEKVSYANLIGASSCYGDKYVYEEPEPYALELAISALEKQIPKKPTDIVKNTAGNSGGYLASCPNCHYHILVYRNECHCDKCGQKVKLDWSVEE